MSDSSLLESVLDSSPSFMCVLDAEGVILNASDSFASLVGPRGRESLKGQQIRTVMRGRDDLEPLLAPIGATSSGAVSPCPVVVAVYEGREKPLWAKFSFARVVSSAGSLVLLTGCDVTAEVDEKRRSDQRAHERSSLLVRMSNEIRTPLNTVLGYAQLMQGLHDLSPVASEYLSTIIANENALLELINNVLELSKYESGQTDVASGETDLRELISGVAKAHADLFERKGIALTVDVDASVPDVVLTDASKVRQIVSNVVGNALKFTRKGGVTVSVYASGGLVSVDVEDTGIGIDPAERGEVFEVFQGTSGGRERAAGSGIGLAVARIFARMLGGDVALVRSDVGKGSLFRVTFSLREVEGRKKAAFEVRDYNAVAGISKPCKVLLVDDVDINLAMLEIFLAPVGFDVSVAANGYEAVEKFKGFKPDIIFMDLIMPERDGFDATRDIKAISPETPVVALTASIVDSVKEEALKAGVDDFMTKPFVPERFFEMISCHTGVTYLYKDQ